MATIITILYMIIGDNNLYIPTEITITLIQTDQWSLCSHKNNTKYHSLFPARLVKFTHYFRHKYERQNKI